MIRNNRENTPIYQFPGFLKSEEINHAVFTRIGGMSTAPFDSLNISFGTGDIDKAVELNRKKIKTCLSLSTDEKLIFARQVHGTDILIYKKHEKYDFSVPFNGDAIITDIRGRYPVIQVADCQPVLLYDPIQKTVAAVHSGWKGSINNIIGKTIKKMAGEFGCKPENILAGIGPSLGKCCAEFINHTQEIPAEFIKYKDDTNHYDFWEISRDQLISEGVRPENIEISGICTKCNSGEFFSYRKSRITGRFGVVIGLRS